MDVTLNTPVGALAYAVSQRLTPLLFKMRCGTDSLCRRKNDERIGGVAVDFTSQRSHLLTEEGAVILINADWS